MADHLRGRIDLAEIRRQNRRETDGAKRVTRRAGESAVSWPVASWPVTVADVLAGGVEGYAERAAAWADAVVRTLDAAEPNPQPP